MVSRVLLYLAYIQREEGSNAIPFHNCFCTSALLMTSPRLDAVDVEADGDGCHGVWPPRQGEQQVVTALAQPVVPVQRRRRRQRRPAGGGRRRRELLALALPGSPPLPPHVHLLQHLPVLPAEQGRLAGRWPRRRRGRRRAGRGSAARRPASKASLATAVVVADEAVEPHHQVQDARLRLVLVRVVKRLDLEHLGLGVPGCPPRQIIPAIWELIISRRNPDECSRNRRMDGRFGGTDEQHLCLTLCLPTRRPIQIHGVL